MTAASAGRPDLDDLFHPRAIAVAGVSTRDTASFGGWGFVAGLQEIGFPGPIYLVHPTAAAVRGIKCYPSLRNIPDEVDHVISAVPARHVPGLLEDCIVKGVRLLHLYTSGFSETGDVERARTEQELAARARAAGIRLLGPNCMGIYAPASRLAFALGQGPEPGPIGMVSQSGMNCLELIREGTPRGLRFSKVVSYGNGIDLRAAELIDYLAGDPDTEIILGYLEGIQDGPRLSRAVRRAGGLKPVVLLKAGRTEAGSRAANSHTASLAGSLAIFDGLCRQAGAVRVESLDDLQDMAVTFRFLKRLAGPNVAVVGGGGGASVAAADDLADAGLAVPPFSAETRAELARVTREAGTSINNPIDSNSLSEGESFAATIAACAKEPAVDVILFHTMFGRSVNPPPEAEVRARFAAQVDVLRTVQEQSGKAVVTCTMAPPSASAWSQTAEFHELCWRAGIASYFGVQRAARSMARLFDWQRRHER